MIIQTSENKYFEFQDNPTKGEIIDVGAINTEIEDINEILTRKKAILSDSKKLLAWAVSEYPFISGINDLENRKKELLLKLERTR